MTTRKKSSYSPPPQNSEHSVVISSPQMKNYSCIPSSPIPLSYSSSVSTSIDQRFTSNERIDSRKSELAYFLETVGFSNATSANLLHAVADINTLAAFTDEDYEKYNVALEMRCKIYDMLGKRRLRLCGEELSSQKQWNHSSGNVIRPPPGLGYDAITSSLSPGNQSLHQPLLPTFSPYHLHNVQNISQVENPVTTPVESTSPYPIQSFLTVDQYEQQYSFHSEYEKPATVLNKMQPLPIILNDLRGVTRDINSASPDKVCASFSHSLETCFGGTYQVSGDDDNNMEADLLAQVGGQMAVSILDF